MNVTLLQIDASETAVQPEGERIVRVLVEVDGASAWYPIRVEPNYLPGIEASLMIAGDALHERLATEQRALYRICKLAGRELTGQGVTLPELVAA